eukprot:CAMPEP_0201602172 /NCGR_PEP_ID=MMETSP0492-20130828/2964_1 /ASSEMBLY_ACC=CAM_ASM_000837 /TAXON_ID=420259 /ORGANISM="Thalassiosira gravida, Strain GMp14c1" /LENGTH=102 /DNA_ID=CAMNT_0048065601 /DNA_START=244 /DNA_END=552 /DNA_ORIENTATION=-
MKEMLAEKPGASDSWTAAVIYQMLHALALLSLSAIDVKKIEPPPSPNSWSGGKVLAAGTAMFSGSIYLACMGVVSKQLVAPLTPVGGLTLITGWAMVGMGKI